MSDSGSAASNILTLLPDSNVQNSGQGVRVLDEPCLQVEAVMGKREAEDAGTQARRGLNYSLCKLKRCPELTPDVPRVEETHKGFFHPC